MGRDAPHAVYRCWDAAERLLYVGRSKLPEERWVQHQRSSPWAAFVATREVQWFAGYVEALEAELTAIHTERPLHNVAYVKPPDPTVRMSVRVAELVRNELRWHADQQGLSVNDVVQDALDDYITAKQDTTTPAWLQQHADVIAYQIRQHASLERRHEIARLLVAP